MQTTKTSSVQAVARKHGSTAHAKPMNMRKRICSTVYEVRVYFNQDTKETINDKILRLVRNEAASGKAVGQ